MTSIDPAALAATRQETGDETPRGPSTGPTGSRDGQLLTGRVVLAGDGLAVDLAPDGRRAVRRAAGCLLRPEVGDTVLVFIGHGRGPAFVLSVLEKAGPDSLIEAAGHTRLVSEGELTLSGRDLRLAGERSASLSAPEIEVSGVTARLAVVGFTAVARAAEIMGGKVRLVADGLERLATRVVERCRSSYRTVEETDSLAAGRVRTRVRGRHDLTAKSASLLAEDEIKMDAGHIHLG